MSDLARLRIWDDQAIRGALSWLVASGSHLIKLWDAKTGKLPPHRPWASP
jgi:hypothetical protein